MYEALNRSVLASIPKDARSILDVGCGAGALGMTLKGAGACSVSGVTHDPAEADLARTRLDDVYLADLEKELPPALAASKFDVVVASHVLEHLRDPGQVLGRLKDLVAPGGCLVVALPNVLFWKTRLQFLTGRFRYTEGGILDRTHLRFFDRASARALCRGDEWSVELDLAEGHLPGSRFLGPLASLVDGIALRILPGLLAWQFIFRLRKSVPGE